MVETLQRLFDGPRHWAAYFGAHSWLSPSIKSSPAAAPGANIVCYSSDFPSRRRARLLRRHHFQCRRAHSAHRCLPPDSRAARNRRVLRAEDRTANRRRPLRRDGPGHRDGRPQGPAPPSAAASTTTSKATRRFPEGFTFAGIASGVKHSVGGSHYRRARLSAFIAHEMIARDVRRPRREKGSDRRLPRQPRSRPLHNSYFRAMLPPAEQMLRPAVPRQLLRHRPPIASPRSTPPKNYFMRRRRAPRVSENARVQSFRVALIAEFAQDALGKQPPASSSPTAPGVGMLESPRLVFRQCPPSARSKTDLLVELVMARGLANGFYAQKNHRRRRRDGGTCRPCSPNPPTPRARALAEIRVRLRKTDRPQSGTHHRSSVCRASTPALSKFRWPRCNSPEATSAFSRGPTWSSTRSAPTANAFIPSTSSTPVRPSTCETCGNPFYRSCPRVSSNRLHPCPCRAWARWLMEYPREISRNSPSFRDVSASFSAASFATPPALAFVESLALRFSPSPTPFRQGPGGRRGLRSSSWGNWTFSTPSSQRLYLVPAESSSARADSSGRPSRSLFCFVFTR